MGILVNFEDTYGIADIAGKIFFNQYMEKEYNEKRYGNVIVRRGLSTNNILSFRTIPEDISTIIYVYDMDRQKANDPYNFLEPDTLKMKIENLMKRYNGIEMWFVPVAFSAETICLHMLRAKTVDFSQVFSKANTAHLHTRILTDILSGIHDDKEDRNYWSIHGQGKVTFNTKRTRAYTDDLEPVGDVYEILTCMQFSETNKCLFEWICGGKIEDTTKLLKAEQAIELQKKYKDNFEQFIQNHIETVDIDNITYRLDINYK